MNLKDAILSTLSEIEDHEKIPQEQKKSLSQESISAFKIDQTPNKASNKVYKLSNTTSDIIEDQFLEDLRERILVLFEGFQSPNNVNIEAKIDLTLNFLEHLLAKIDKKIQKKW